MATEGQMAIGPIVLGGVDGGAYQELKRTTRMNWQGTNRVGKPRMHEFLGPDRDTVVIEGTIYPLYVNRGWAADALGLPGGGGRVGPQASDLGGGQLGGQGLVELMRRLARTGKPFPVVMGNGAVCGLWVILEIEEKLSEFQSDGVARKSVYRLVLRHYGLSLSEYARRQQGGRRNLTEPPLREVVESVFIPGQEIDP